MTTREVPEPWATRMKKRGFTKDDGSPNLTKLARAAGLSVETVRRAVHGRGSASVDTLKALEAALGQEIYGWMGAQPAAGPYVPPVESAFLTDEQRDVLDQLIRTMSRPALDRLAKEYLESIRPKLVKSGDDHYDLAYTDPRTGEQVLVELKEHHGPVDPTEWGEPVSIPLEGADINDAYGVAAHEDPDNPAGAPEDDFA